MAAEGNQDQNAGADAGKGGEGANGAGDVKAAADASLLGPTGVDKGADAGKGTDPNKAADADKSKDGGKPANEFVGVPEKYEAYALPEGVKAPDEVVSSFNELAKKIGLSQKGAQEIVNFQMQLEAKAAEGVRKNWSDMHAAWRKEIEDDPEIGGKNFDQTKTNIAAVLNSKFASKGLREAFDLTGAANNPAIVRFVNNIGKAMTEAKLIADGASGRGGDPDSHEAKAKRLFPSWN